MKPEHHITPTTISCLSTSVVMLACLGMFICMSAGATGRLKLLLTDWDGDGVVDLLIGTGSGSSVPGKNNGLPHGWSGHGRGAAVLFLKNVGTNENPVMAYPAFISHKGAPIFLGHHEIGVAVGEIAGEPCLIVGRETGRLYYYKKSELGLIEHAPR